MPKPVDSILDTIGQTPIVRLARLSPPGVNVFAKVESFNPGGSVKDRMALSIIEEAERSGALKPGQTVVEATSGNTGIGLAVVCARKGYPLVIVMAESFSIERRKLMRFLGAKVVLTPAAAKGTGMLDKAVELADTHGWFLTSQFENAANPDAHVRTTGPEILEAFEGERLDAFVTGFGTGGTLNGVSRVLRKARPETKIVVCEPDNSPLLGSGIAQEFNDDGSLGASHPAFRPHLMQGWSPDFIAKIAVDAVDAGAIDQLVGIDGDEALAATRALAQQEGIFCGVSGGATLAGALQLAKAAEPGANILCMLPDTGERYLSTPLFESVPVEMTEEETEISRSTPTARFDAPPPPPAASVTPAVVDSDAAAFVERAINDADQPVVMFALAWCEFCWSARKMFAATGVLFRSVDLDSVEYQKDNRGAKIRAALNARTGIVTIPQVFIGGEFIGGAVELLDRWASGDAQRRLGECGVAFNEPEGFDPYAMLPGWVAKR